MYSSKKPTHSLEKCTIECAQRVLGTQPIDVHPLQHSRRGKHFAVVKTRHFRHRVVHRCAELRGVYTHCVAVCTFDEFKLVPDPARPYTVYKLSVCVNKIVITKILYTINNA